MQYKILVPIKIRYLTIDKEEGVSDLTLTPTNPSGADQTPIVFSEMGDGLYTANFTPNAVGWWLVKVSSLTKPKNIYSKSYYVGTSDNPYPAQEDGKITSIDTKFGEVQTTPTANSLLGRLKDIWDKLVELFNPTNGTAKVKIWDGTTTVEVDTLGYFVEMNLWHHRVHEGELFNVDDYNIIASGNNRDILIITGSKEVHINYSISSRFKCEIYIYEDTTVSSNGTVKTIFNMNRVSANTSLTTCYFTPTIISLGTLISMHFKDVGVITDFGLGEEYILKPNSKYLLRVSSLDNNNNACTYLNFYEA